METLYITNKRLYWYYLNMSRIKVLIGTRYDEVKVEFVELVVAIVIIATFSTTIY